MSSFKLKLRVMMSFALKNLSPACDSAEARAAWYSNDISALRKGLATRLGFDVEIEKATSTSSDGTMFAVKTSAEDAEAIKNVVAQWFEHKIEAEANATPILKRSFVLPAVCDVVQKSTEKTILFRLFLNRHMPPIPNRQHARRWVIDLVQESHLKICVRKVVPLTNGRVLEIELENISATEFEGSLKTAFNAVGKVEMFSNEAVEEHVKKNTELRRSREEDAGQLKNVSGITSFFDKALTHVGSTWESSKRSKAASQSIEAVSTCIRVTAAKLREAQESAELDNRDEEGHEDGN